MTKKILGIGGIVVVVLSSGAWAGLRLLSPNPTPSAIATRAIVDNQTSRPVATTVLTYTPSPLLATPTPGAITKLFPSSTPTPLIGTVIPANNPTVKLTYVSPRQNIPKDAPTDYGFWSFSVPVSGILSRSGQPLLSEFKWLKDNGWKSDINLRVNNERNELADDAAIPGFTALGLHYLRLPMADGSPPTNEQAKQFLDFVNNPANQPAHVHCRGGIGRTGTMVALYRYAAQKWPLKDAIAESRPYQGGISDSQAKWLTKWAATHAPGSW